MRKFCLFLIFINLYAVVYNQVIKGTVKDQRTDSAIYFASIYFNGTFVGTHTDQNGYFELDISKNASMPLTVSALGYYSVTMYEFQTNKAFLIYLTPKVFELKEVVINYKYNSRERKANLRLFRNEFLGTTGNALNCQITNENDIILTYDSENDTLKAYSSKPIHIDNNALGYKITCYLDKFEFCKTNNSMFMIGNIIFDEDSTVKKAQKQRFERRRKSAFIGSRMQFVRALWENSLDSTGFLIMDSSYTKINYNNIVIQTDSITKYFNFPGDLYVSNFTKLPSSRIYLKRKYVYFDKNGYFDPSGIVWSGELARQRIADWLPYEYSVR